MLLRDARVLTPDAELNPGYVHLRGERIAAVGAGAPPATLKDDQLLPLAGRTVVPGFVDLHVHGGDGCGFDSGERTDARRAVEYHRRGGTTRTLASLMAAPPDELVFALGRLATFSEEGLIEGIHLEGPFLSPRRPGAQDRRAFREPDRDVVAELLRAGRGQVRMMTVAPELPGATEVIRQLVDAGVVAAIGHSDADYATAVAAVDAGATVATHLGNAMREIHQREPGIAVAALDRPEVTCELIADGHHLHPAMIRTVFASAPGRVSLVTDAASAAGAPDGRYLLGSSWVEVGDGAVHLEGTTTIAGSALTTGAALRYAVKEAGVDVRSAVRALSETPAGVLGLRPLVGTIEVGKLADLVVLDAELGVESVVVGGQLVRGGA